MGAQRHSAPYIIEACKRMRDGVIGKITYVRCYHLANEYPNGIGKNKIGDPPGGLDWDMWLGPAPKIPFNELVWNYKFRWFWDYSGGQMTNFGTHWIDVIHMALGRDEPARVTALGGKFAVEDDREIPDTMEAIWDYGDALVTFTQINANNAEGNRGNADIEFRGTLGTLYIYGNRYEIIPQEIQASEYPARGPLNRSERITYTKMIEPETVKGTLDHADHLNNFFECVKTREKCNCDVETGHKSTASTLIANVAYRTGAVLEWDAMKEKFENNRRADKYLEYSYRKPWNI
jgi:predicted dehydrogenase